ncbi:M20 family metallo-hydrolase [Acidianus manzaensis]|nr:M20 family metallo-hydrolase [Acidianus manzaensis]
MDRVRKDIENIGKIGKDPNGGVSRPALSEADIEARMYVMREMEEAGLKVYVDQGGNIIGIKEGEINEPFITTGSHIDTVLNGGIFDGVVGVVGGLETIRLINENKIKNKFPIALIVFTDEEGNSFTPFAGSKYFAGLLKKDELHTIEGKYENIKFGDALKRFFEKSKAKVIEKFPYSIKNHFELHVEQGPILEKEGKDIGIVLGIVGVLRIWANLEGKQSHAGTTPMNMRSDPSIPLAKTILKVREIAKKDIVGTLSYINVFPNVVNVIPGSIKLGIDIRSLDKTELEELEKQISKYIEDESEKEKVKANISSYIEDPVLCAEENIKTIEKSVNELGYSYIKMPSRAVHDSQIMSRITKIGMIFVPSKNGISHAPDEWTDWNYIYKGVNVLYNTLKIITEAKNNKL